MKIEILPGTELLINDEKCVTVVDEVSLEKTVYFCDMCVLFASPLCGHFSCSATERQDGKAIHFEKEHIK